MSATLTTTGSPRQGVSVATDPPGEVIHSHHYNTALHRAISETEKIDVRRIIERSAAEVAYQQVFERIARLKEPDTVAQLRAVDELFRASGLGALDLTEISLDGGTAVAVASHHAVAWHLKHGRATRPVCHQVAGILSGALTAVFGRSFDVTETACAAVKGSVCQFRVSPAKEPVDLAPQVLYPLPRRVEVPEHAVENPIDSTAIGELLVPELMAHGDGFLEALGTYLTRFGAEYYNKVSFRFEEEVPRVLGSKYANLPSIVLTEAGHQDAFHTLGGLTKTEAWVHEVAPLLLTREDWLFAFVGVINRMGWGTWRIESLVPGERLTVRVYDSYEGLGYRLHNGRANRPKCYHTRGVAAGLMNLIYVGNFAESPMLTPSYYNQLFRSPLSFRAMETRCRAFDEPYCEFVVNPLSPTLGSIQLFG